MGNNKSTPYYDHKKQIEIHIKEQTDPPLLKIPSVGEIENMLAEKKRQDEEIRLSLYNLRVKNALKHNLDETLIKNIVKHIQQISSLSAIKNLSIYIPELFCFSHEEAVTREILEDILKNNVFHKFNESGWIIDIIPHTGVMNHGCVVLDTHYNAEYYNTFEHAKREYNKRGYWLDYTDKQTHIMLSFSFKKNNTPMSTEPQ